MKYSRHTLVNMAHYGMPQFAEVFPARYKQNWRKLPLEYVAGALQ